MTTFSSLREHFENPDLDEVRRADAVLAFFAAADDGEVDVDDARAALVGVLNEPLCLLPRLAHELLSAHGPTRVGADVSTRQLRLCPHDDASLVADADTALSGRRRCVDCDMVVVDVKDIAALAPELEFSSGFFTGPALPKRPDANIVVDSRFLTAPEFTVGAGTTDTVINLGVPAGGLTINADENGATVTTGDNVVAFVRAPLWLLAVETRARRVEQALARTRCALPPVADIAVYRRGDADAKPAIVTINRAPEHLGAVTWEGFGVSRTLRLGETAILSFDRRFVAARTLDGIIIVQADQAERAILLARDEVRPLPIGDATVTWNDRGLVVRGCPPSRSHGINLAVFAHGPGRRR